MSAQILNFQIKNAPMDVADAVSYLLNSCGCSACKMEIEYYKKDPVEYVRRFQEEI